MDGSKRTFYLVVSLAVFLAALGVSSARIVMRYRENLQKAQSTFQTLKYVASNAMAGSGHGDLAWRTAAKQLYKNDDSVLLVVLHSPEDGILNMVPRSSPYLSGFPETQAAAPEFLYPPQTVERLSAVVAVTGGKPVTLEILYSLLRQRDVYEAARDGLLIAAAWTALSLIVVTILGLKRASPRPSMSSPSEGSALQPGAFSLGSSFSDEDFDLPDIPFEPIEDSASDLAEERISATREDGKASVPPKGLYSPASGLGWEQYLAERLNAELSRAASFEQDLVLLEVSHTGISRDSSAYRLITKTFLEFFNFRDLTFELGDSGFAVIHPNIDADHALHMAEVFLKKVTGLLRQEGSQDYLKLFMGLSSRSGRLVDASLLLMEASAALKKARNEGDSRIVAFKADPNKYRAFVAAK
jgi:hypothetical protein